jgi:Undecaprenyl-phosphate glucose phosphotransferase
MLFLSGASYLRKVESAFFSKHGALLDMGLRVSDLATVTAIAYLMYWLKFRQLSLENPYDMGLVGMVLLVLLVFPAAGLYRSWRGDRSLVVMGRVWIVWSTVMLLMLALSWGFKRASGYSRLVAFSWYVAAGISLCMSRLLARWLLGRLRARGIDLRRVVLIGSTEAGQRIVAEARIRTWMGLDVIGYVRTPYDVVEIKDVPCLGDLDDFMRTMDDVSPDQIWVTLPMRAEPMIRRVLEATLDKPATIRLVPDFLGYELINHHASILAGVPVITLRGSWVEGHAGVIKALEDRFIAALSLILLGPLMVLVAVGVKLSSPGPVIYQQKRHGLGGKEIEVWKFRSMRVHTDSRVTQAKRGDSRVTPFGRFLRASSLDELPQLINVLRGDMSIVGPRPHAVEHNREYSELLHGYMQRHGVKPGMTGLAQVKGLRGETDTLDKMARRVECDISYIEHWSLWLDLKIIVSTPFVLMKRTNAY